MTWVYRILFPLLLIPALPYYFWRMLRRGGYGAGFSQRLGFFPRLPAKTAARRRIWIQAVSVGEIEAIGPLLLRLKQAAAIELVLTTTTSTGYRLARERYTTVADHIGIFPTDLWPCSALAWSRIQPDQIILIEGELWPEHLAQARARGIPAHLINGRISDRSFARHQRFRTFSKFLFSHFTLLAASSEEDARRFRELGQTPIVTGNLKFDVAGEAMSPAERRQLRTELGFGHEPRTLVLLGSSTWPGEESMLLAALGTLRAEGTDLRLLLVPRHSERRAEVLAEIKATGFAYHQRSTGSVAPENTVIHLADTTGELRRLTRVADLAFCGKSLAPHEGGQTPIEAAAAGVALLYGPQMSNFREICRGLEQAGAAQRVASAEAILPALRQLCAAASARQTMGENGAAWHHRNRGATERTATLVLGS